jgi:hypothetical protein
MASAGWTRRSRAASSALTLSAIRSTMLLNARPTRATSSRPETSTRAVVSLATTRSAASARLCRRRVSTKPMPRPTSAISTMPTAAILMPRFLVSL